MVKIEYAGYPQYKMNAWLGGEFFSEGILIMENDEEGIAFAQRNYLRYQVITEVADTTKKTKKAVKKDGSN